MTSTEFMYSLCSPVTFNLHCESRAFVDSGKWYCPGHVVALSQSRPRPTLVALCWSAWSPAWKVTLEELDHFYLDVRTQGSPGMPCQHLTVHSALSAMLKTTFTMAYWLSVPAWLTVEEVSWCHSVLASKLCKYVFLDSEIRDPMLFSLSPHWNGTLIFAPKCRSD